MLISSIDQLQPRFTERWGTLSTALDRMRDQTTNQATLYERRALPSSAVRGEPCALCAGTVPRQHTRLIMLWRNETTSIQVRRTHRERLSCPV